MTFPAGQPKPPPLKPGRTVVLGIHSVGGVSKTGTVPGVAGGGLGVGFHKGVGHPISDPPSTPATPPTDASKHHGSKSHAIGHKLRPATHGGHHPAKKHPPVHHPTKKPPHKPVKKPAKKHPAAPKGPTPTTSPAADTGLLSGLDLFPILLMAGAALALYYLWMHRKGGKR